MSRIKTNEGKQLIEIDCYNKETIFFPFLYQHHFSQNLMFLLADHNR